MKMSVSFRPWLRRCPRTKVVVSHVLKFLALSLLIEPVSFFVLPVYLAEKALELSDFALGNVLPDFKYRKMAPDFCAASFVASQPTAYSSGWSHTNVDHVVFRDSRPILEQRINAPCSTRYKMSIPLGNPLCASFDKSCVADRHRLFLSGHFGRQAALMEAKRNRVADRDLI